MRVLGVIGYYTKLPIFRPEVTIQSLFGGGQGGHGHIVLMIIAGLLAIPIGLSLNAAGWFCLGWLQSWGSGFWFDKNFFLTRATREIFHQDLFERLVDLNREIFIAKQGSMTNSSLLQALPAWYLFNPLWDSSGSLALLCQIPSSMFDPELCRREEDSG